MGHSICYQTFAKDTTEKQLREAGHQYALRNADREENPFGVYDNRLTIHRDKVYESEETAKEAIASFDNGWYDDHAVLFRDLSTIQNDAMDKKISEIEIKITELLRERMEYGEQHSVKTFKSKQVGCAKCASKLTIEYLHGERCPVCNHDLRGKTTLDTLARYDERIRQQREKQETIRKQYASKAQVRMLCKFEVHC